jgi:hypothetical protein
LRGLGAEQKRQRLSRRDAPGLRGVLARGNKIAGADGDQSARNRLISALAAAMMQMAAQHEGRAKQ